MFLSFFLWNARILLSKDRNSQLKIRQRKLTKAIIFHTFYFILYIIYTIKPLMKESGVNVHIYREMNTQLREQVSEWHVVFLQGVVGDVA